MRRSAWIFFIAAYFVWFAFDGTRVGWTEDDPMNLYLYWKPGFAKVVVSNLMFWTGFYRPLGGLFYLPIYAVAGMSPAPYRWAMFALLAVNTALVYRFAWKLSNSTRAAGFAALLACVHGGMADLVYNTSSIYDVLAVTFSLLALLVYQATSLRFAAALLLMILAVNAKEIAATLPAFFLLYELIINRRPNNAWTGFVALAVAALAMYGKMHGPEAMTVNEAYHPVFVASRWLEANVSYTAAMLYQQSMPTVAAVALWIVMALATILTRSRVMAWALCALALSTIPISFIPKRVGGSLYLPLVVLAIWAAAFIDTLLPKKPFATATVAFAVFACTQYGFELRGGWWRNTQGQTDRVQRAIENLNYQPPHGKRILFTGSPYKDVYDLVFLANLVWNDRTLVINDANMTRMVPSEADIVIGFKDNGTALELLKQ